MVAFIVTALAPAVALATSPVTYPASFTINPPNPSSGICIGTYASLSAAQAACIGSYPWDHVGGDGVTMYHHTIVSGWIQDSTLSWHITAHYCARLSDGSCTTGSNYNDQLIISCPNGGTYQDPATGVHVPGACVVQVANCPAGQQANPTTGQCEAPSQRNAGTAPTCAQCAGDPINVGAGNEVQTAVDFKGGGAFPLEFKRTYNSVLANAGNTALYGAVENLGLGWTSNIGSHLYIQAYYASMSTCQETVSPFRLYSCPSSGSPIYEEITIWHADGSQSLFRYTDITGTTGTAMISEGGTKGQLYFANVAASFTPWAGYQYSRDDGYTEFYDALGRLAAVRKPGGLQQTYTYDSLNRPTTIADPAGRTLTFTYDGAGRILTIKNPANGTYTYGYGANGSLSQVTYPDNSVVKYLYENTTYTRALTGITDEDNNRYVTWGYDSQGRANSSQLAGGVDSVTVVYNADGSADVTEATGLVRHLTFTSVNMVNMLASSSAPCLLCGDDSQSISYDSNGYVSAITDFNGNQTTYVHDATGLETSRTEAYGTPIARTITTTWDTSLRQPTLISEPGRTTANTFDTAGNLLTRTVTDTATSVARTKTYTYNAQDLLATADGPRTDVSDVTSFGYTTTGDLSTITDALGHITHITTYDANGYPTTVVDPNGISTTLTYDLRQRLLTKKVNTTELTQNTYDSAGHVTKVTQPDGSYLQYGYDNAHRLTSITDNLGDKVVYTLDNLGERTGEQTKDPLGNIARSLSRVYDNKEHLHQVIGGMTQTTTYTDDNLGNPLTIADPMANSTTQVFDALNRPETMTDAASGVTTYNLDALDHLTDVTDPRGLDTHYDHDAFGDVTSLVSPDTGITAYTYDLAGNLLTKTDAASVTATYTYDALNRLTSVSYPDTSKNITYTYDSGTNGIGRLTGMADASGTTAYSYDAWGNRTGKTVVEGGHTFTMGYTYDLANRLASTTYPDGMVVAYARNSVGQITGVTKNSTTTVASSITYKPFGPLAGLTDGSGLSESRSYDTDYRLTGISVSGIQGLTFGYNADDDITGITDSITSANSQTLGYDNLNRLTSASGAYGSLTYGYDADGNRNSLVNSSGTATYTLDTASNHLDSISGATTATYGYNAIGALGNDGTNQYSYASTERLDTVTNISTSATVATYVYNGLGQRTGKTTGVGTSLFVYDEDGHLLGEYDGSGNLVQEHIWLQDRPLAVVSSTALYYIHTNQLQAPQTITDSSHTVVWNLGADPFGNGQPAGSLTYNLRLPGQYYDGLAGDYQNGYRDYNATTGRYLQSDPIGLRGGINTYAYVDNNPLSYSDPMGLAPPIPSPPSYLPGGPYTPAGPGQPAGRFDGPKQPFGPRTAAQYVPADPPGTPAPYWKVKFPGQDWQRYRDGVPITPEEAHPGTCPVEEPPPVNPLWENPWLWFPLLLTYSSDAN